MIITISGMKFYAHHGCFEEERTVGTRFIVDVSLTCDHTKAVETDNIEDTVNYVAVYRVVAEIMNHPVHLLEKLAAKIVSSLKNNFPIEHVSVRVCKLNPPLDNQTDYVSVSLEA